MRVASASDRAMGLNLYFVCAFARCHSSELCAGLCVRVCCVCAPVRIECILKFIYRL